MIGYLYNTSEFTRLFKNLSSKQGLHVNEDVFSKLHYFSLFFGIGKLKLDKKMEVYSGKNVG